MIVLDPTLAEFYREVNKYWRDHENTTLNHVTLVSTGGGDKDIQVREGLTPLDGVSTQVKVTMYIQHTNCMTLEDYTACRIHNSKYNSVCAYI